MKLALFLLSACAAVAVLATPHFPPARRHPLQRRQSIKRCRDRPSSSGVPTAYGFQASPTLPTSPSTSPKTTSQSLPPSSTSPGLPEQTGDGTYFTPAYGACGKNNTESDLIVAVSHSLYDGFHGYKGSNPNNNPICGKTIVATYEGKSVTVKVVDRCADPTCLYGNLDFSPAAFDKIADRNIGRLKGVTWKMTDEYT